MLYFHEFMLYFHEFMLYFHEFMLYWVYQQQTLGWELQGAAEGNEEMCELLVGNKTRTLLHG